MAMLGLICLLLQAHAADPTINTTNTSDGGVEVQMVIPATEAQVRAALADPVQAGRFTPDVVGVRVVQVQGNCDDVVTTTRVMGATMDYRSMRCHTSNGIKDTLIESSFMESYSTEWSLRTVEGGTEVTLHIRNILNLPVPTAIVRAGMASSMKTTLLNLARAVIH